VRPETGRARGKLRECTESVRSAEQAKQHVVASVSLCRRKVSSTTGLVAAEYYTGQSSALLVNVFCKSRTRQGLPSLKVICNIAFSLDCSLVCVVCEFGVC
jgi:hypothetical protein